MTTTARLISTSEFLRRRRSDCAPVVPLIVLRLDDLGNIAWRHGRRHALELERACTHALASSFTRLLRGDDVLAHDTQTATYLIALRGESRSGASSLPADVRTTLSRLSTALTERSKLTVSSGWIMSEALQSGDLDREITEALTRGAQERERYAFFSLIGHELRTPLTSIRGYLETLCDESLDDATRRRFLEVAYTETLRIGRLIDGMFDISLLDMRCGPSRHETCRSDVALDAALLALDANICRSQVRILREETCVQTLPLAHDALVQIWINLISNALSYGRPAGVVRVESIQSADGLFCLSVDDDGPGIAPEQQDRIFSLGERGNETRTSGSGIGLAFVRLSAERAGGYVELMPSTLGGCRFTVRLPIVPSGRQLRGLRQSHDAISV